MIWFFLENWEQSNGICPGLDSRKSTYRRYFLFFCQKCEEDNWIAYEETPSDGSEGPITFQFFWVDLNAVPPLLGGLDEMLSSLG